MKKLLGLTVVMLLAAAAPAWAHEGHDMDAAGETGEQTLTGEVVDVTCYLSHGGQAKGQDHAGCAKKCIQNGLPVALKVGDQLYLLAQADHTSSNAVFADLAATQVTVHGTVMERDGQHMLIVKDVQPAASGAVSAPAPNRAQMYTCPMHPDVKQQGPGKCPKCGMALEPAPQGKS